MPVCAACWETLPIEDFNPSTQRRSGRQSYCKGCSRTRTREAHQRLRQDPEYRRSEVARQKERYWSEPEYRQRKVARTRASHALLRGDIQRAPCPCGNPDAEMHHEDYSRPLEVKWLCRPCHVVEHYGPDRTEPGGASALPSSEQLEDSIAALLKRFDERRANGVEIVLIGPTKVRTPARRTRHVA